MLVLILSKDATTKFATWNRMSAMIPSTAERDAADIEKHRYYRLVLPIEPDKPGLSSHPLTWSTISHALWDGYPADYLSFAQQQALLDWIHWGGQLVITGGAGQSFNLLRESFLGPICLPMPPARASRSAWSSCSRSRNRTVPPATCRGSTRMASRFRMTVEDAVSEYAYQYRAAVPITPAPKRPVYVTVLKPKAGAATIPLGEASPHLLAVEHRVGRGRITMLTINPNEEALVSWPGLDTLVRRVILRRPEEPRGRSAEREGSADQPDTHGRLIGQELSWYRITSRDAGVAATAPQARPEFPSGPGIPPAPPKIVPAVNQDLVETELNKLPGVADWRDGARIPRLARDLLEDASGITIPSSNFVMRVILAYLVIVIPLNWLICRFVLNRREWTWAVVPLVALGFAVGVERVAARDIGYDTAIDEIDLLEIHGDYAPRPFDPHGLALYDGSIAVCDLLSQRPHRAGAAV